MDPDVLAYYAQGLEEARLSGTPEFRLELLRTQAILRARLPPAPARRTGSATRGLSRAR